MSAAARRVAGAADGLALEAEAFSARGAAFCLWTARRRALVCPQGLRRAPGFEAARRNAAERGWPVHLRPTGGGAVPQGPGALNLALAFTAEADFAIEDGYRLIVGLIRAAVPAELSAGATPNSFCDGAWNLALAGRKVAGAAQRLRPAGGGRRRVLAHALILLDGDVGAGARAVAALHADLGLPPILAGAHTTLARAMGDDAPDADSLAEALRSAAARRLRECGGAAIEAPRINPPARGSRHRPKEETHVQ